MISAIQAYVFVTGRDLGIATPHDLVTSAAPRPAELTFGSTGTGTGSHLAAALLNLEAGVTAVDVPPAPGDSIVEVAAKVAAAPSTTCCHPSRSPRPT